MSHTATCDEVLGPHDHAEDEHEHGHSHGLVDPSIKRSRAGLRWQVAPADAAALRA